MDFIRGLMLPFFCTFQNSSTTDRDWHVMSLSKCRLFEAWGHCVDPFTPHLRAGLLRYCLFEA